MKRLILALAVAASLPVSALAQTYTPGTYYGGQDANTQVTQQSALNIIPTPCSGTITTANVAQVGIPYQTRRHGFRIQNQSTSPLYIRSTSATGALVATTDQNSFRIDAGAVYEPSTVTDFAYSIIGGTAGQAYHCQAW